MQNNVPFIWKNEQKQAFWLIKELLTSAIIMAYIDQNKLSELVTDASPWGLSAILSQHTPRRKKNDRKIVVFISRSFSEVEHWYSQTEQENSQDFGELNIFICICVEVISLVMDCKPIELIMKNPKSKPPSRIESWNLHFQDYDFAIPTLQSQNILTMK